MDRAEGAIKSPARAELGWVGHWRRTGVAQYPVEDHLGEAKVNPGGGDSVGPMIVKPPATAIIWRFAAPQRI